jgi:hypothetical protein
MRPFQSMGERALGLYPLRRLLHDVEFGLGPVAEGQDGYAARNSCLDTHYKVAFPDDYEVS